MNFQLRRAILYYPTVKITNTQWLKQSALYWDLIGTIAPHELEQKVSDFREFRELEDYGMLRYFHPESYVQNSGQLLDEFISIRNSPKYQSLYEQQKNSPAKFGIHVEKMSPEIRKYILDNHIAVPGENTSLAFKRLDGLLYMSLLAKYIADEDGHTATIPGTDYRAYRDLAFLTGEKENRIPVLSLSLEQILPAPRADVTLAQVLTFKRNRGFELRQFREVIDGFQSELKQVASNGELQHLMVRYSERIKNQVELLDRLLNDANIAATYNTMDSLMSIDRPAVLGELLGAIANPTPLNLAAKVINGVIKVRKQRIDAANARRQTLTASAYSYLYQANREGIINRP